MRVAFVVPRYGPDVVGGAETLVRGLAEHLAVGDGTVEVLTTCARDHLTWRNVLPPGATSEGRVTVRRFPVGGRDARRYSWLHQRIQRGRPISLEDELRWAQESVWSVELFDHLLRRRDGYDAVCFAPYLYGTTLWGVALVPERAVLIPCLHDEPFARLALVRAAFQAARGYVFNTAPEARLAETLFGLAQRPAGVVGLGFDLPPPTEPAAFRRRHGLSGPIVLYLGRKETGKNVPMLIHYFQRYRETRRSDVTLVLAGDGPVTAPRGAPGIRDLGYLEPADKEAAYAAATVVCQPSVNESFSIVLMEAWLAERPVLVHARCPVTTDHVMRSSGGLPFADYFEFAEALTLLLEDEACRRTLGAQGRRYVASEFAWPTVMARFRAILGRLAAGGPGLAAGWAPGGAQLPSHA